MSIWLFFKTVAARAWHRAEKAGHKIHIIGLLIFGAVVVIGSVFAAVHFEEAMIAVLVLIVIVLVFVFSLFYQCYAVYREEFEKRILVAADGERKLSEEKQRHEEDVVSLRAQLEKYRTAPIVKATRIEIERWIGSGRNLVERIENYIPQPTAGAVTRATAIPSMMFFLPSDLQSEIHTWIREVNQFVREKAPSFFQHYGTNKGIPPRSPLGGKRAPQISQSRDQIADKVDRLVELLEMVK